MTIIKLTPESNGAYASQTAGFNLEPPPGWTVVPDHLEAAAWEFLPWIKLTIENGTITNIEDNPDKPEPEQPTPAEQRKEAYETEPVIPWEGEMITVDAAGQLWLHYAAEDSGKAAELTELIVAAKAVIRDRYPDGGD